MIIVNARTLLQAVIDWEGILKDKANFANGAAFGSNIISSEVRPMVFEAFMNEEATLRKKTGETYKFKAMIQPTKIFTENERLPVEEGDAVERTLPNGMTERYIVLERGFKAGIGGIANHYQMKVRKDVLQASKSARSPMHIYNLTGAHARVNIQSEDNSINISSVTNEELFSEIANAIKEHVANEVQRLEMLEKLSALEQATDKPTMGERYREFIACAADYMTLLTPFLPALTALLVGTK